MMKQRTWQRAAGRILVLVAIHVLGCQASEGLDEDVAGVYFTTDKRYDDRSFELSEQTIAFGIGNGRHDRFEVAQIGRSFEADRTVYTVHFANTDGDDFRIEFYHDSGDGGTITFKHRQDVVWKKRNSEPSS